MSYDDKQCSIACSRSACVGAARTPPRSVRASRPSRAWPAPRSPDVISCIARLGRRTPSHRAGSDIAVGKHHHKTPETGALGLGFFFACLLVLVFFRVFLPDHHRHDFSLIHHTFIYLHLLCGLHGHVIEMLMWERSCGRVRIEARRTEHAACSQRKMYTFRGNECRASVSPGFDARDYWK